MGLFDKLFGRNKKKVKNSDKQMNAEHAVIIIFNYGIQGLKSLHELEAKLEGILTDRSVGEYDGHEIAIDYSDGSLYMYGPDAEKLYIAVKPVLETTHFLKGAIATLRFGPPEDGVKEIEIIIGGK